MKKEIFIKIVLFAGLFILSQPSFGQTTYYGNQQTNYLSSNHTFSGDIVVGGGTELIISGTVKMDKGTKIQVQQGGRLVINGGTVTTNDSYNELWEGIEVHGHARHTDHPNSWGQAYLGTYGGLNTTSAQDAGVVVLKNNATVSRAKIGIWAGSAWLEKEGGIIISINSTIIDCQDGVVMDTYLTEKNRSYFRNTKFISQQAPFAILVKDWTDPNDRSLGYDHTTSDWYSNSFITLNNVLDVPILGCDFDYQFGTIAAMECNGPLGVTPCHKEEDGFCIIANDATFLVDNYYSGPSNSLLYQSRFMRAKVGIVVKELCLKSYRPIIRNSYFENCFESIRVKGSNNVQIHHNRSILWHDRIGSDNRPYGISMEGSTGYNVENNIIDGRVPTTNSTQPISKAILVTNSGDDGDLIYKNELLDVYHGIHAQNDNRGVEFDCNRNDQNTFSPAMIEPYVNFVATQDGSTPNSGLANQGGFNRPVYNIFEHYCTNNFNNFLYGDFFTDGISPIDYYHPTSDPDRTPNCHNTIATATNANEVSVCPDKLLKGGTRTYIVSDILPGLKDEYVILVEGPPVDQDEIDEVKYRYYRMMNEYIGTFLDHGDAQGAIDYLQMEETDFARRKMIPLQIQVGDYEGATAAMNVLDMEDAENKEFKDYYTVVNEVYSEEIPFDELNGDQIATLEMVAESPTRISTQAQNWLELHFGASYAQIKHPVTWSSENQGYAENPGSLIDNTLNNTWQTDGTQETINFYPNPANNVIYFTSPEVGRVVIKDVMGRVITTKEVTDGVLTLDNVALTPGLYYLSYNAQTPQRLLIFK